jgi:hypothetical protein
VLATFESTADPVDHFEVTVLVPVTISIPNFNWLEKKINQCDKFIDQKLLKAFEEFVHTIPFF